MRVELSRFVEGDLDAIADYIAQDNPTRAASFIREIGAQIHAVGRNPLLYQLRPEIGEGARMAICWAVCDFVSYDGGSCQDRTRSLRRP